MEKYRDAYSTRGVEQVRLIEGQSFALGYVADFENPIAADDSIDIAIAFPSHINPIFEIKGLTTYLFRLTNQDQNNNSHAMEIILTWTE